jgi:hypothetical protein
MIMLGFANRNAKPWSVGRSSNEHEGDTQDEHVKPNIPAGSRLDLIAAA